MKESNNEEASGLIIENEKNEHNENRSGINNDDVMDNSSSNISDVNIKEFNSKNNNANYKSISNGNTIDDNVNDTNYLNNKDNVNNQCNNNSLNTMSDEFTINNKELYNSNSDLYLDYKNQKTTNVNLSDESFLKNVDNMRTFERGIVYLSEEEYIYMSNKIKLLGFRFIEIPCAKPKTEKRNTFSAISKRHLNEIKNLHCSLSNNIYDAGKRKSKKSYDKFYSKDEISSSTATKENVNDIQKYNDNNNSAVSSIDHIGGGKTNNNSLGGKRKFPSNSLSNVNVKSNDNINYGQNNRNNSMLKKGEAWDADRNNNNKLNNSSNISNSNKGKGKLSKCTSIGSGKRQMSSSFTGGKEALKKKAKHNNNYYEDNNTIDEYEEHRKTYRKRIYKCQNAWKNNCFKILHKLKKKEMSCWFLKPVNPELDGIPNYFNIIKNPMDFETIENKLLNDKYNSPFQWQQDVRQIFYNAFTYHKVKNCVWNDAYKLAKEFDRLLNEENKMKNIHIEYTRSTNSVLFDMKKYNEILINKNNNYDSDSSTYSSDYISDTGDVSSDYVTSNNNKKGNINNKINRNNNSKKRGNAAIDGMNNSSLSINNLSSGSQMFSSQNKKGLSGDLIDHKINKSSKMGSNDIDSMRNIRGDGKYIGNKKDKSFAKYGNNNLNSNNSNTSCYNNSNSIDFEPPSMGTIPEPPGIQKIGINDKGLNNYQVNLLFKNLRRLAPNQRRAALEIIQDDLGILAENHMFDRFFTFDTELLSIEKQKRIFLYINHMGRINLEQYKASRISSENMPNCNNNISRGKMMMQMKNANNNKNYMNSHNNGNSDEHFDKRRGNRYVSSSSNSSDTSSSNSSDSSTFSTSSDDSESDSESDMDFDSYNNKKKKLKGQFSNDKKKEIPNKFFDNKRKSLPQYKPVDEKKKSLEIREDVMGIHADFLGSMDTPKNQKKNQKKNHKNSGTAWPEWKGQVIQQAILTQRQTNVPINKKELIAEGYDAKI
ncbi:bromodomain protein 2, putative [Plasmodium berghei]|uniref:Bromodomain protein 2, putative n=1 Tax=Plasmodium berghei TaxID=5821 RepID=A0A0Z0ASF2_PLABE|nr:bromodomain protein 2, putative [Plasmodium berghei]